MRSSLRRWWIAGLLLTPLSLPSQGLLPADSFPLILSDSARVQIVKGVISRRVEILKGVAVVDGCSLANAIGDSTLRIPRLQDLTGAAVRGAYGACLTREQYRSEDADDVVYFRRIRRETNELIRSTPGVSSREPGLVVVKLIVYAPKKSESHEEEWVLREGRPGSWVVETIRIFSYGYT
jgi:hypothetical protein